VTASNRIAMPPEEFQRLVCGAAWAQFEEHGEAIAEMMRQQGLLAKGSRLLDVGCGCGRIARWLVDDPIGSYLGFDRHRGMIDWCRENFSGAAPHFDFRFYDLKSAYSDLDGQRGDLDPEEFEFPFEAGSFDSVVLVSVFTHMPLGEIEAYLRNLHRILAPGGRILLSVFFAEAEPEVIGLGFYHRQETLESLFERRGFAAKQLWPTRYGPKHNWYLLRTTDRKHSM
jgi:SAM-dependent methyltransferase